MTTPEVALRAITSLWTGVVCVDLDGAILSANGAFASMVGSTPEALMGRSVSTLPERGANLPFFEGLERTTRDGETRRVRHDSAEYGRVFDSIMTRSGDMVIIEVADVTEEVREHDRRAQIQSARDVIWSRVVEHFLIVDLVGRTLSASPTVREKWPIHVFERAVQLGSILNGPRSQHAWTDPWTSPADTFDGRIERTVAEVFESGLEQRHQTLIPLANGRSRYFDTQLVPWSVDDTPRGVIAIIHDLTEQFRALESRSDADDTMAQLLAGLPVTVWEVDVQDTTLRPLFADRRRPMDPDWGMFRPIADVLPDLDDGSRTRLAQAVGRLSTDGSATVQVTSGEAARRMQVSLRMSGVSGGDDLRRAHAVITDVTQEVNDREAESRADRASHLMRFAEGVGSTLDALAREVSGELLGPDADPKAMKRAATAMAAAAARAGAVSSRLTAIADLRQLPSAPVDLGLLAAQHLPTLQQRVGPGITVSLQTDEGLRGIADRSTMTSALDELCANASEAMAGTGTITIAAGAIDDRDRSFVEIAVTDDGPGFAPEPLARAFDPFVTGAPDQRIGLGLFRVKQYLNSIGGEASVESSPEGSTVRLWFPAAP